MVEAEDEDVPERGLQTPTHWADTWHGDSGDLQHHDIDTLMNTQHLEKAPSIVDNSSCTKLSHKQSID